MSGVSDVRGRGHGPGAGGAQEPEPGRGLPLPGRAGPGPRRGVASRGSEPGWAGLGAAEA